MVFCVEGYVEALEAFFNQLAGIIERTWLFAAALSQLFLVQHSLHLFTEGNFVKVGYEENQPKQDVYKNEREAHVVVHGLDW